MDQHPIPQDVTGFQFKLIGSMTVKQFGFVACGVILAVICYYMIPNSFFWLMAKFVLIPLFGGSGVLIAFVPIDGRPIDVMTNNFIKALFSPNQYIYKREGKKLSFASISATKAVVDPKRDSKQTSASAAHLRKEADLDAKEAKLRAFLSSSQSGIKNDLDKKEAAFLKTFAAPSAHPSIATASPIPATPLLAPAPLTPPPSPQINKPAPVVPPPTPAAQPAAPAIQPAPAAAPLPAAPTPQTPENKEAELTQKENQLEHELTKAKQEEAASTAPPAHEAAHQKVEMLAKQIDEIHTQKQQLEQELAQLKNQLAVQKGTPTPPPLPATPAVAPQPAAPEPPHVRAIPADVSKKAGLPRVSDTPNVVVGIVKDPRGNVLPNILVEVKDKDGNPVRAFKTNPLGQFASATPLSPGTYTMELEDPKKQNRFDVIQITANNQILPAMEVISHDAREDLRKQLFAS